MAKKKKIKKTNEERILDENGIEYEEKNFNVFHNAVHGLLAFTERGFRSDDGKR